jgi:hypothetical protein
LADPATSAPSSVDQSVREDIMRSTITAFALIGGLVLSGPSLAQGTPSPSAAPKQPPPAPVGHRQPRQSDITPSTPSPTGSNTPSAAPAPDTTEPNILDPDGRLERALKSICRGC